MLINKPTLPPKAGYVEDENESGERYYRKIETEQDKQIEALQEQTSQYDRLLFDLIYSITLLELGVI